ncbi:MAG: FAD-binding protein [Methanomassiliicoccales archaeon]|nr:FAD-binding protein [Methanomassiliicoccales archaeon]
MADLDVDLLVVGHGAAGLLCGSLISSRGRNVAIAGRTTTATALSTGCFTLFRPPRIALEPSHTDFDMLSRSVAPFNSLFERSPEDLASSLSEILSFIVPRLRSQGLPMSGDFNQSYSVLSNTGLTYSCSVSPSYVEKGRFDWNDRGSVALLGILGLRDFDPDLAVRTLESAAGRRNIRAYWTQMPEARERYDMSPSEVAALGERVPIEEGIAGILKELDEDAVGLPPLFPLPRFARKMEFLERQTGKRVFEVATPMSLPGERLQDALENVATQEGCKLMKGLTAVDVEFSGSEASSVIVRSRSREQRITFSRLIMATGDLVGGGLVQGGDKVEEAISSLQVETQGGAGPYPSPDPGLSSQTLRDVMLSGVRADSHLRLFTNQGGTLDNVFGAGSLLSGFSLPTGVGMGGVLLTSWMAAMNAMEAD